MKFSDRAQAGKILAKKLSETGINKDSIVLALPRGGLPVAYEVASRLGLPLDVFVVRKLGFPGHEELAMGAIATGGTIVLDKGIIQRASISQEVIDAVTQKEERELQRREKAYRDGRAPLQVQGRDVILVDDGLATGSTMRAAVQAIQKSSPNSVTVAVPVGAEETCSSLTSEADSVICATTPDPFYAVGMWYEDFTQTTDEQVQDILRRAYARSTSHANSTPGAGIISL